MKLAVKTGFLFITLSFLALANAATLLTPPWYLLQKQLQAILNADPCIKVDELTGEGLDMEIKVNVCNDTKAQALASFVTKRYEFGNQLAVRVSVYAPGMFPVDGTRPASMEESIELLGRALNGNKYFIRTGLGKSPMAQPAAYAIFRPAVIQYHSDDISDWYLNSNEVAAKVFSELLNLRPYDENGIKIFATTAPITNE